MPPNDVEEMFKLRSYSAANDYEQIKRFLFLHDEINYDLLAIDLFLEYSSEYCFLIENRFSQEICGLVVGALNLNSLNEIYKQKNYFEKFCVKYPIIGGDHDNQVKRDEMRHERERD